MVLIKNKQKYLLIAVVMLVALIGVRGFRAHLVRNLAKERGAVATEYSFSGGKSARAVFHRGDKPRVEIALSDGRKMILRQTVSASGARYANTDESIVFWIKGDTAFLEENGEKTYRDGTLADK